MHALGYLPLAQDKQQVAWLRIPFGKLAWATVSLPLFSFIFCVVWSVLYNFDKATFTHCKVVNYLPSISAAIGNFSPQRDVWRTAIGIHALPRLLVAAMYYRYYRAVLYKWAHFLAAVACWLTVVENLALVGLTFVSSSDNYPAHEKLFVTFLLTSELYMVLTCVLVSRTRSMPPDNRDSRSLKTKWRLLMINVAFSLMAVYWFMRHNSYCEPGVYTLFALSEYVVVLTNMAFHMTAYWDFHGCVLMIGPHGGTGSGVSGSGQTDSSTSSERTEAESLSTEDSSSGESPVAWIKPQMQNQVPSRLRMQHVPPDSPDLCRIPCCCGGQPSSIMATTEIPFKDPRTYETEDTCPVLMVSGRSYPQPEGCQNFPLHFSDGVWMSYPVASPHTTEIPEDPEWTRRRVVAVEQQQWNRYLAATAQAGHIVPQFGSFIPPTFTMCHVQPKPDVVPVTPPQVLSPALTSSASSTNSLVTSNPVPESKTIFNSKTSPVLSDTSITHSAVAPNPDPPKIITVPPSPCNVSNSHGEVDGYEETLVLRPAFVKWIVLPSDLSRGLQPVARLLPRWDSSLVGSAGGGFKSGLLDELLSQTTSCPDFTLQRFHF